MPDLFRHPVKKLRFQRSLSDWIAAFAAMTAKVFSDYFQSDSLFKFVILCIIGKRQTLD